MCVCVCSSFSIQQNDAEISDNDRALADAKQDIDAHKRTITQLESQIAAEKTEIVDVKNKEEKIDLDISKLAANLVAV